MPRPRLPTDRLELTGAFAKNPQRRAVRAGEPRPTVPLGDPPRQLDRAQSAVWRELAGLAPWLTAADRIALELTARLLVTLRANDGLPAPHHAQLVALLTRLGLTPADRSKINAPQPEEEVDPAEAFFGTA